METAVSDNIGTGVHVHATGFQPGIVNVQNSLISGNDVGIDFRANRYNPVFSIRNSTVSGNASHGMTFTLFLVGDSASIAHSTIVDNGGVGIQGDSFSFAGIHHSIISGNTAGNLYVYLGGLSLQYSLLADNTGTNVAESPGDANGNIIGGPNSGAIDPMLGSLQDNGGATLTHALLTGSPAINRGDPAAMAGVGGTPLLDQRGPGFRRVENGRVDMGAFEVQSSGNADFDEDGSVTGKDFLWWQRGFGDPDLQQLGTDGDADDDSDTDADDLRIWEEQYGSTTSTAPRIGRSEDAIIRSVSRFFRIAHF